MSSVEKKWFKSVFSTELEDAETLPEIMKTQFTSKRHRPKSKDTLEEKSKRTKQNVDSKSWMDKCYPKSTLELAVHQKKIKELQEWFTNCHPNKIMIITGPTGSGKTTAVKIVAKEMRYTVVEWTNPTDYEFDSDMKQLFRESQLEVFKHFLFQSSRYKSVLETKTEEKKIILVEDIPNALVLDSTKIVDILELYEEYGKCPLVFIITDMRSKHLNLAHSFCPDSVKQRFKIQQISFNPIASSFVKGALKRAASLVCNEDGYSAPTNQILENIASSCEGDIRNALHNLYFGCLTGSSEKIQDEGKIHKKLGLEKHACTAEVGRSESLTLMHALGRVLYPKFDKKAKGQCFEHSPEDISEAFSSEPKNFVDFIHANYLNRFSSIENVADAMDTLSQCDLLLNEYNDDVAIIIGLNIANRGVMVHNRKPASGWKPIKGPNRANKKFDLMLELSSLDISGQPTRNLFITEFRTFVNIIKSKTSESY